MSKRNPFDFIKAINMKTEVEDLVGYVPFLTNRAFAMHMDTVMIAEEMNQYHSLSPALQFDFYYYAVRKGRRFGFPKKLEDHPQLELVMNYFNYSRKKAEQALELLSESDLCEIRKSVDKGGM